MRDFARYVYKICAGWVMDKWSELRTAYFVGELGTISAAATRLGLHRATVNRHIDALEADIGAPLFLRHGRGYTLTEAGEEMMRTAKKASALIEHFANRGQALTGELSGEITVTTLDALTYILWPTISAFRACHPNCTVHVVTGETLARLEYGDADLAVRVGPKPDNPDYVVQRFRDMRLGVYAHDKYVARRGMPDAKLDLHLHDFVGTTEGPAPTVPWLIANVPPERLAIRTQSARVQADAIMSGFGIGFVPEFIAQDHPELHEVVPSRPEWQVPVWLVTHVDLHRTERIQRFLEVLRETQGQP